MDKQFNKATKTKSKQNKSKQKVTTRAKMAKITEIKKRKIRCQATLIYFHD